MGPSWCQLLWWMEKSGSLQDGQDISRWAYVCERDGERLPSLQHLATFLGTSRRLIWWLGKLERLIQ